MGYFSGTSVSCGAHRADRCPDCPLVLTNLHCLHKLTRLPYNCAHLRWTKETLTIEDFRIISKKIWVKIFWVKLFLGEIFGVKIFLAEIFFG